MEPGRATDQDTYVAQRVSLARILFTFVVFGLVGFGGPAAHLALMERELVARRGWLSREHFLHLLAMTNLAPGPNSTEMAFHIGLATGGLPGMILAGLGFIAPAVALSTVLAAIYVAAGSLPAVQGVLLGVKPVILVLILSAAYRLGAKALSDQPLRFIFGAAMIAVLLTVAPVVNTLNAPPLRIHELVILVACGLAYMAVRRPSLSAARLFLWFPLAGLAAQAADIVRPALLELFGRFLLIGATLFGSGYVLAAYMERSFVQDTGWLSAQQLLDTFAIGQSTPGPVLSTAAAAGYVMTAIPGDVWSGVPGAIASAVGVFTPAFFIVLALGRIVPYLRRSQGARDFLGGVNAGVIALLVGAFVTLAASTLIRPDPAPGSPPVDLLSLALVGLAFVALERWRWPPGALIIVGAGVGLMRVAAGWV